MDGETVLDLATLSPPGAADAAAVPTNAVAAPTRVRVSTLMIRFMYGSPVCWDRPAMEPVGSVNTMAGRSGSPQARHGTDGGAAMDAEWRGAGAAVTLGCSDADR
jgi:hypothetical protein